MPFQKENQSKTSHFCYKFDFQNSLSLFDRGLTILESGGGGIDAKDFPHHVTSRHVTLRPKDFPRHLYLQLNLTSTEEAVMVFPCVLCQILEIISP